MVKEPLSPDAFKKSVSIWNWYTSSVDPEVADQIIQNFTLSLQGNYFPEMMPKDKLLQAYFAGKQISVENNFEIYISPRSSLCYRTKPEISKFQTSNGETNGYKLTIFTGNNQLNTDNGVPFAMEQMNLALSHTPQFEVSLDHPQAILTDVTVAPIVIQPGMVHKIALKRQRYKKSPNVPVNPCRSEQTDESGRQVTYLHTWQSMNVTSM